MKEMTADCILFSIFCSRENAVPQGDLHRGKGKRSKQGPEQSQGREKLQKAGKRGVSVNVVRPSVSATGIYGS